MDSVPQPLVSVLMTSFNREKFIGEAIRSVLDSTYSNFELIIVDDKSSDNTVGIAKNFALGDKRIRVYENDSNLGDYSNRNKAATYATGELLKYVDSDDKVYPHTLSTMVSMMDQFPSAGFGISVPENCLVKTFPQCLNAAALYRMQYYECPVFFASPGRGIFRRSAFDAVNGFQHLRMTGDFEMWHRIALQYDAVLMPAGITWYRQHGEQEVKDFKHYLTGYEKIKLDYLLHADSPFSKAEAQQIIKARKTNLLKIAARYFMSFKWKAAWYRLKVLNYYRSNGY